MAIRSQQQQECGSKNIGQIRRKYFNHNSKAADWWDQLRPEWRGLVLYAAGICSSRGVHGSHLSKCSWQELSERLDYRAMIGLKRGIAFARQIFEGFGPMPDSDFSRRTTNRAKKTVYPIKGSGSVEMVIAPHIVNRLQQGD